MSQDSPSMQAAGYPPGGGPPGGGYPPPGGGYPPPGGGPPGGYPPPGGGPPGGFGGPPGGGPPGGFGGPPGGGGFGGPPGGGPPGGFGGPPGGFGGPPGGPPGGFGGPPGYGPPPGFGSGMGGGPPKKSGSNLGLIIGLGCGGVLLVGIILAVIGAVVASGSDAPTASKDDDTGVETPAPPPPPAEKEAKLELQDIRFYNSRGTSKIVNVVGELVNVGDVPVNAPRAKITVYDASKTALDDTICGAFIVRDLQPNEKVPCYAVMSKASGYKTYKVEPEHSKSFLTYRAADLKISDVDSTSPRSVFGAHKVTGTVTNKSTFTAKSVWVIVGLYDGDGKIVGAGRTVVAGNDLDPGAAGKFTVSIFNVADKPKKSLTKVFGYDK